MKNHRNPPPFLLKFLAATTLLLSSAEQAYATAGGWAICTGSTTTSNFTCSGPFPNSGSWEMDNARDQANITVQCCPSSNYSSKNNSCTSGSYAPYGFSANFTGGALKNSISTGTTKTQFLVTSTADSNYATITNVTCNPTVSATETLPQNVTVCFDSICAPYSS